MVGNLLIGSAVLVGMFVLSVWLRRLTLAVDSGRDRRQWVEVYGLAGDRIRMSSWDADRLIAAGAVVRRGGSLRIADDV